MIALSASHILDQYGNPIKRDRASARAQLADYFANVERSRRKRPQVEATYDAARTSDEFKNYWANADAYDADSAHSPTVRAHLVQRSRYEIGNNGFADGIAGTYSTDLVGRSPSLRMQTGSEGFNRMVEASWYEWTKEIQLRRKLLCMAHAKHSDGESFGVIRRNKNLRHRVKLDLVLHETEQVATPALPYMQAGRIDGIHFDEYGNPTGYDLLKSHPGSNREAAFAYQEPEYVPAKYMLHWFKMRRPGQHRGVPEMTSTLNLGAAARRWRESVVSAAEEIANWSILLKTQSAPDEMEFVPPMSTLESQHRMMTALPYGYDAFQPKAEQPTATHAEFNKSLVNEMARPKSMPYNKAACDSSSYNYASGRLDHQTYYGQLNVDRDDCEDLVLDRCFEVWFEAAVIAYGWLGGDPAALSPAAKAHVWDWPKHQVADIKAESAANDTKLKNATTSLTALYSDAGLDYEDELIKSAASNGITVDQQRQINLLVNLPTSVVGVVTQLLGLQPPAPTSPPANQPAQGATANA